MVTRRGESRIKGILRHGARWATCLSLVVCGRGFAQNPNAAAMVQAQKAYKDGSYVDAAKLFYMILQSSGGTAQSQAQIALGKSLEQLGLRHSAAYFYIRSAVRGPQEPHFREAMENLARLNEESPLGRASIDPLFKKGKGSADIQPLSVPSAARGFYFFYRGLREFEQEDQKESKSSFSSVPSSSPYFSKAQYYLGVMNVLSGNLNSAVNAFEKALNASPDDDFSEMTVMALARAYYEQSHVKKALSYYSRIPRHSDLWLESLFEGAWSFFLIQKHNNTLGNIHTIHSPFFRQRFFPETYILQAITFLKLCEFDRVKMSLASFKNRYKPTFKDLSNLLNHYQGQPSGFFELVRRYRVSNQVNDFPATGEILDSVSRSVAYKEASNVLKQLRRERSRLTHRYGESWRDFGLLEILMDVLEQKMLATQQRAGINLFSQAVEAFNYLQDLDSQVKLIQVDTTTGKTDQLRAVFNKEEFVKNDDSWGEGMKPLDLRAQLEYWPFEGEYWEDELGGYVYNMGSKCGAGAKNKGGDGAE